MDLLQAASDLVVAFPLIAAALGPKAGVRLYLAFLAVLAVQAFVAETGREDWIVR